MYLEFSIEGGDFVNAGKASSEVKGMLKQLGVPAERIKRIIIALYEAEVNIVAHAHRGTVKVDIGKEQINVLVEDCGPGIVEIDQAMREGFSTASREVREMGFGAGMGLPNIKRNSDYFVISSEPGKGTVLKIINTI